uniref:phospholipase A2 n=1 Tax=Lygus hesperus TaxID=30085 RepID=A0A0A9YX16_LYGHE
MAWLTNTMSNILKRTFNVEALPNQVIEVKTDKYDDRPIIHREEGIFLYAGVGDLKYEIVMHKPFSQSLSDGYSLFRSAERHLAEEKFIILKDKLTILLNIANTNLSVIQKYCNTIEEHPSWNVCHLVVFFNLVEAISLPSISSSINSPCALTGLSPLQLAVQEANLVMIQKLIACNADLLHLDHDANSVYHFAAATNKDVILALAAKDEDLKGLNQRNVTGHTPLHMACLADKPDCVIALISKGADVNQSAGSPSSAPKAAHQPVGVMSDYLTDSRKQLLYEEMKYGGTPLHWASSRDVIEALIDRKCDINALNFASRTALQVMVMRNRVECVVALLSREADVNIADLDGNTALHLAVKEKNIPIVQALIVFGADLDLLNNSGETARHIAAQEDTELSAKVLYTLHAVGAARCTSIISSCSPGCAPGGNENGTAPQPASAPAPSPVQSLFEKEALSLKCEGSVKGGRVLALDGGGIRGLVLTVSLLHLEAALGRPLIHCFDWIAATSTGGMLGLALAAGKTLKECLCIYFRMKDHAFVGFRPYNSEPLETMLKDVLGNDTVMGDIKHPRIMITACLADRKPVDLHLFRNYESPNEMLYPMVQVPEGTGPKFEGFQSFREQKIWEAARATGAAPSYFRAYKRYVDGGLISNNPTLDAITEIHEYNTALSLTGRNHEVIPPKVIVSIGTGSIPLTQTECMDLFWPSGLWDTAKLVSGVRSMQAVLVDQATLADGRLIDRTRAICSMLRIPYFRFSPTMTEEVLMDEKSDVKLVQLLWETKAAIFAQSDYVNKLATLLNS